MALSLCFAVSFLTPSPARGLWKLPGLGAGGSEFLTLGWDRGGVEGRGADSESRFWMTEYTTLADSSTGLRKQSSEDIVQAWMRSDRWRTLEGIFTQPQNHDESSKCSNQGHGDKGPHCPLPRNMSEVVLKKCLQVGGSIGAQWVKPLFAMAVSQMSVSSTPGHLSSHPAPC